MIPSVDRAGFIVSFDGPEVEAGRIDVRDLAPALLTLGRLIDAANLAIYGEKQPIKIEVKALSEGSFEVVLEAVRYGWAFINNLLEGASAQHAKNILEWLGLLGVSAPSLVDLYRFLNGKHPTRVTKADDNIIIELDGKTTISVPPEVMRLYQEISVNRAFSELLTSVEGDGVTSMQFRGESAPKGQPSLTLSKADRAPFSIEEPPATVIVDVQEGWRCLSEAWPFRRGINGDCLTDKIPSQPRLRIEISLGESTQIL